MAAFELPDGGHDLIIKDARHLILGTERLLSSRNTQTSSLTIELITLEKTSKEETAINIDTLCYKYAFIVD